MSRLNFRGWDGKRMHKIVRLGIGGFSHDVWTKDPVITTPMFFKSLKIMQSTGLHDKNGVEIFEGDVLISKAPGCEKMRFVVFWDKDRAGFKARDGQVAILVQMWNEREIAGNIYQHPELLK